MTEFRNLIAYCCEYALLENMFCRKADALLSANDNF